MKEKEKAESGEIKRRKEMVGEKELKTSNGRKMNKEKKF